MPDFEAAIYLTSVDFTTTLLRLKRYRFATAGLSFGAAGQLTISLCPEQEQFC
jgi:hypothetical protein